MSGLSLAAIYRYPLKSARGEALTSTTVDAFGVAGDRRWMLVDGEGVFVTQRCTPSLALLAAETTASGLLLRHGADELPVDVPPDTAAVVTVDIWGDRLAAHPAAGEASAWVSARLGRELRLVYLPATARRQVDTAYARPGELVAFSDGFPLLLITQASLDGLNARLPRPVPMNRFRPNLVIDGAAPHAEDHWQRLRIGDTEIALVKACSRCAIPSIDQATAERDSDINRVLAAYRRRDGAIYFGMNALAPPGGAFSVGDAVAVLH